ncbi:hypothetical protein N665_0789s0013 [Sinapis alba]|nr:hypothetical protein N665_0789s0013 [Sinapis alba]
MDPFSQPCSFQNLLNSQQPNTSFFFVSREPSVELSASDGDKDGHIVSDRKERRKWSSVEDVVLITIAFWKRIASYFGSSPKLTCLPKRDPSHCKKRWGKINEGVCKFVGCYNAATKQKSSGQSGIDVLIIAHEIFFNDYKIRISKKKKLDDQSAQSSTSVPGCHGEDEAMAYPIRQKDSALKEKLNKQKLLDNLIAKIESLSELEIALKTKLITDMLSSWVELKKTTCDTRRHGSRHKSK